MGLVNLCTSIISYDFKTSQAARWCLVIVSYHYGLLFYDQLSRIQISRSDQVPTNLFIMGHLEWTASSVIVLIMMQESVFSATIPSVSTVRIRAPFVARPSA